MSMARGASGRPARNATRTAAARAALIILPGEATFARARERTRLARLTTLTGFSHATRVTRTSAGRGSRRRRSAIVRLSISCNGAAR